jgi:hypothetical protein
VKKSIVLWFISMWHGSFSADAKTFYLDETYRQIYQTAHTQSQIEIHPARR